MKKIFLITSIIILLPIIYGFLINDMIFSGLTSTTDGNTYYSIMNQAKEGNILFTNMYTHEEIPYLSIKPTFMVAGWFSIIFGNIFTYHLFRILGLLLCIFYLDKLLDFYFKKKDKLLAMIIIIFASGIGWFFKLLTVFGVKQYGSIDLWVGDANTFTILLSHPHTIISLGLFIGAVYHFINWYKNGSTKQIIFSGILTLILGFEHLFDVITLCFTIFILLIFDYKKLNIKKIKHLIIFGIFVLIPLIYTYMLFTNPAYSNWNDQNMLDTPKFLHVIFGFGGMFAALIGYLFHLIYKKEKIKTEIKLILCWILSVMILIYSPFNIQRRFFEGVHIPFGIITGLFLFYILKKYVNVKKWMIIGIIFLLIPTNAFNYFIKFSNIDNERGLYPYRVNNYIYPEEKEGLLWLIDNSESDSTIISSYNIGNYIPSYVNRRVYLGHWAQTYNLDEKKKSVDDLFEVGGKINIPGTKYVWFGVDEEGINFKGIGEKVFENEKVKIYRYI